MHKRLFSVLAAIIMGFFSAVSASAGCWSWSIDEPILSRQGAMYAISGFDVTVKGYSDDTVKDLYIPEIYYPSDQARAALEDVLKSTEFFGMPGAAALAEYISRGGGLPVSSIGYQAFIAYYDLTFVSMPDTVTRIGDYAFYNCLDLETVIMPQSLTTIGQGAFRSCKSIRNLTLPEGLTTIEDGAFTDCNALQWIQIPNSVSYIGDNAFEGSSPMIYTNNIYVIDYANRHHIAWR